MLSLTSGTIDVKDFLKEECNEIEETDGSR